MKHNSQRDEDAERAHDKKLSRTPITIDSDPDDGFVLPSFDIADPEYNPRYDAAMELCEDMLTRYQWAMHLCNDLLTLTSATTTDYDKSLARYKELRDSE